MADLRPFRLDKTRGLVLWCIQKLRWVICLCYPNQPFLSKLANAFSSPSWMSKSLLSLVILKTSITLGDTSQNFKVTPCALQPLFSITNLVIIADDMKETPRKFNNSFL